MQNQRLDFDITIVGAGPAGLFAAHRLLELRPNIRIALLDRGQDVSTRLRTGRGGASDEWLSGVGGAGFFIGGRMSFDLTTLSGRPSTVPTSRAGPITKSVDSLLTSWGATTQIQADPPAALAASVARAEDVGLVWHVNYPARHLSEPERIRAVEALEKSLKPRTQVYTRSTAASIQATHSGWRTRATVGHDALCIDSRMILLAPGRAGAEWMAAVLMEAGAELQQTLSAGVRVETRTEVLAPLTDLTPDPRLSMDHASGPFRTYAFAVGGRVCETRHGAHARISCRPAPRIAGVARTENTSFAVLWQPNDDMGQKILDRQFSTAALSSLRAAGISAVNGSPRVVPTLDIPTGDVRSRLPEGYWTGFEEFIRRVDSLAPGAASASTLLYSPAMETVWNYRIDENGQTDLPGVFVAGDGAGVSQGAMAAAVSGWAAAEGIDLMLGS